ncbi:MULTISPECIES: prephenate dehydrogenase [Corallincola]|uniref:Prephenate dehydrogenase n=2 Tax=Corallincola TaxID=1775176 RepID=A0ABY1WQD1_9GAMM|nr:MULTISPECIES: prephenate dehydrogenase [Corallincola]TAA46932.1 prephenate dehydrogenase [Corallincola spongiicola]TCI04580.1 prephenate dehydrogenase [Corallincola luteus]
MSSHDQLFEHLSANLKQAYRQAIDADAILNEMLQLDVGKFDAVFRKDQGFECEAIRFVPYVEELAAEIEPLKTASPDKFEAQLKTWVSKLELLLRTLAEFKRNLKAK